MTLITINSGGALFATITFRDEGGNAVVPTQATWTLTDGFGTVINARQDVVLPLASSTTIVLTGDDNPPLDDSMRILTVKAKYLSALLPGQEVDSVSETAFYVNNTVTSS